jgi:chromosome segregation ATPase
MKDRMAWLRDHMKSHVASSLSIEPTEKILHFPNAFGSAENAQRETALDLVNQAAEVIMSIETQAAEIEVRARNLARDACGKLQLAESHIQSLEAARRTAEQGMHEANVRAHEAEQAFEQAQSRAAAAEAELCAMERRVKAAETRADETQQTLIRVENAIRTKLLNLRRTEVNKRAAVA